MANRSRSRVGTLSIWIELTLGRIQCQSSLLSAALYAVAFLPVPVNPD